MSKFTKRITAMLLSGMLAIGSATGSVYAAAADVDPGLTSEIAEEVFTEEPVETSEAPVESAETSEIAEEVFPEEVSAENTEAPVDLPQVSEEAPQEEAVISYTVTLDANGGYFTNEWDDSISDYVEQAEVVEKHIPVDGAVAAFPVYKTEPEGQTMIFAGWSLERDGVLVSLAEEEYIPVENCVLYAVWQASETEGAADLEEKGEQEVVGEGTEQTDPAQETEEAAYAAEDVENISEDSSDAAEAEEETQPELNESSEEEETVKEESDGEQAGETVEEQAGEPDKEQDEDSQDEDSLEETVDIDQDEAGEQINEDASAATVPIATSESYRSGPYYTKLCNTLDQYAGASQKERFVQIALSQKGYKASTKAADGSVNLSGNGNALGGYCEYMYIINPGLFGNSWCAAFVSWCGRMAGLPEALLPTTAAVGDFRDKGSSYGTVHKLWSEDYSTYIDYQPKKGDIVLLTPTPDVWNQGFRWNKSAHVAIVSEDATTRNSDGGWIFKTIERGGDYNSTTTSATEAGNTVGSRTASTKKMRNEGYPWFQMIITPNWEDTGGSDTQTPRVHNTLPVDMGEEFYAYIRNQSQNAYLTNQLNNIGGEEFTGNSRQIWRFNKQSNGAYSISSVYDNACMDVLGITLENGSNVYAYTGGYLNNGNGNQEFYIYRAFDAYYFSPAYTNGAFALDMSLTTHNLEMWGVGPDWAPQEFDIITIPKMNGTFPADLGEEFCAYIRNQSGDVYLTNQLNNIGGEEFTGNSRQIWRFNKQSNGAYSISSVYDNACMDVLGITLENGSNVYAYTGGYLNNGNGNQEFYIYRAFDAYYFSPAYTNGAFALDMSLTTHNLEMWGVGPDWAPQEFDIIAIPVSIAKADVTGIKTKTYTGKALTQTPVVKLGSTTLKNNTDYKLTYKNNTNAGTATMTITGTGNYAGTITKTFTINKAAQSITAKAKASAISVGKTTTVSLTGNKGSKSFKSSDTAVATVNASTGVVTAKKVGTVKITATSAATANYKAASKTITIKVVPAATASLTAANQVTGIKLTWKKVTGANGYKVYRGSTLIKTITSGNTVTFADTKANTNGTKYTYKVIAKAATGDSTLSKSVAVYRVARPAVSSVTNSAASKMTIKWGKNAKATGYRIQYSTDKTFKSGNKAVTVAGASAVSKVIGSLTKSRTYYVRIRTYKTVGSAKYWSVWSAAKSVKP